MTITLTRLTEVPIEQVAALLNEPRNARHMPLAGRFDLAQARARVGARVALQGNLDPMVLLTDPETVAREAIAVVEAAGPAPGHIFNLGHGIVPRTPPDNVAALVEAVHRASRRAR